MNDQYRYLQIGETLQKGDILRWEGLWMEIKEEDIGKKVNTPIHFRRLIEPVIEHREPDHIPDAHEIKDGDPVWCSECGRKHPIGVHYNPQAEFMKSIENQVTAPVKKVIDELRAENKKLKAELNAVQQMSGSAHQTKDAAMVELRDENQKLRHACSAFIRDWVDEKFELPQEARKHLMAIQCVIAKNAMGEGRE